MIGLSSFGQAHRDVVRHQFRAARRDAHEAWRVDVEAGADVGRADFRAARRDGARSLCRAMLSSRRCSLPKRRRRHAIGMRQFFAEMRRSCSRSAGSSPVCSTVFASKIGRELMPRVAVEADVAERVEVGEDLVVVALRERIELVVVALAAAEREAEDRFAERFHAIDVVVGEILLGDRAALVRVHVVALEAGGDELGFGVVRQQVAGELLAEELVVRHVRLKALMTQSRHSHMWRPPSIE